MKIDIGNKVRLRGGDVARVAVCEDGVYEGPGLSDNTRHFFTELAVVENLDTGEKSSGTVPVAVPDIEEVAEVLPP